MAKVKPIKGKTFKAMMKEDETDIHRPHLHMELEDIPEAKEWEFGPVYELIVHVRQTSLREDKGGGNVGFEILGIAASEKNPVETQKKKIKTRYKV